MCVDDYKERMPGACRPRVCRRFVIEDEQEMSRTFYVNISQFQVANQEVALCKILIYLEEKGLVLKDRKFYMPKFHSIVEPFTFCRIKFEALNETDIILKSYHKNKDNNEIFLENQNIEPQHTQDSLPELTACYLRFQMNQEEMQQFHQFQLSQAHPMEEEHEQTLVATEEAEDKASITSEKSSAMQEEKSVSFKSLDNLSLYSEDESKNKNNQEVSAEQHRRTREPERVIGEVLFLVKVWRQLHEKKRWSLIQAAKLIGISKKSLDDYYLVLRTAEILGYDFEGNINRGMGQLRYFLRSKGHKISGKLKNPLVSQKLLPQLNLDMIIQEHQKGNKLKMPF